MPKGNSVYCCACGRTHGPPVGEKCEGESHCNTRSKSRRTDIMAESAAVAEALAKVELSKDELDLVEELKGLQQKQNIIALKKKVERVKAELEAIAKEEEKSPGEGDPPPKPRSRERTRSRERRRSGSRDRRRRRSRTRQRTRSSRSDRSRSRDRGSSRSEYTLRKYLKGKESKDVRYDELMEAMLSWAYIQDGWEVSDYRRYIGHIKYIAQKARSRIYIDKAMVDYDAAVRELVDEHGLELFRKGNHECTMDHFSVENTRQAQEQRRAAAAALAQASGGKQKGGYGPGKAPCKAFNYGKEGCKDNHCRDAHKCAKCGRPSHKESDCWDGNKGGKRSKE